MPRGKVTSYFSHTDAGSSDGAYRVVRLVLDDEEVFSYIEFESGKAGVETQSTPNDSKFWYSLDGVARELIMEFFLMCFEAPVPKKRGWKSGKTYEW